MNPLIRRMLSSAVVLATMTVAAPAFAASLTIEQRSAISAFGTWVLTPPTGNQIRSQSREERRTLSNLAAGTYLFQVDAPDGATTTIRFLENGVIQDSVTAERLSFSLDAGSTATLQVGYTYQGTITVESIPSGASFELFGPNGIRYTGITPRTFREVPPAYYSVNFGLRAGCSVPRPIRRDLEANDEVVFLGEYRCASASSSFSSSSSSPKSSAAVRSSSAQAAARIVHTLSQSEVLPGGSVRVTVGIVNAGRSTLRDLMLSEQVDPSVVSVDSVSAGAQQQANMIVWRIPEIFAGQRWSESFVIRIAADADPGTTLLSASLSGDALDGTPQEQLLSTATLGIATLPATGGALDLIVALLGLLLPAPALLTLRHR